MEIKEVKELVVDFMDKMNTPCEDLDINRMVDNYRNGTGPFYHGRRVKVNEERVMSKLKEKLLTDDFMAKIPVYAKHCFFSWEDVFASMITRPEKVWYLNDTCPDCGGRLVELEFRSPSWTWRELCGSQGPMTICIDCPLPKEFRLEIMNYKNVKAKDIKV